MFCSVCDISVLARDKGVNYTLEGINLSSAGQEAEQQQQEDNGTIEFDSNRREVYDMLYDRYDTCAYCGGKYQDE